MTTYKSLKSLCESLDMPFYEIPELSDQEQNVIPEDADKHYNHVSGFPHSEETKELLRQINTGRKKSPETIEKMRIAKKNMSEETKKKIGIASSTRRHSEDSRKKMSLVQKGRKVSEETRKKLSDANKKRPPLSDATKQKMSVAKKNVSEETRLKYSMAAKKRHEAARLAKNGENG